MQHLSPAMRTASRLSLLLLLLFIVLSYSLQAQVFPSGFSRVQVANGISNPTVMAFAPDGRIFVAQQNGTLRIIKNGSLLSAPFLQLTVNSSGERGLIGIALDPNFSTNQFVYVYYTLSDGSRNRISRFTGNGDIVTPGSEVVILNLDPLSSATNHNGGAMHFKNGLLYVAIGENANGAQAQNLDTYHGKILRINPDGTVPAGNPFTSGSEQRRRIWSYGLRNPYTFDIQPGTGRVMINDVGQGTWEEINDATTGGLNFGWPSAEGTSSNPAFTNPVYAYAHGSGDGRGCAITGGVFFNPATTNYPAEYTGRYFFQDLCNRWINVLNLSTSPATRLPFATGLGGDALSIDVGNDGNLYYLERSSGALYKIIYTVNTAPVITQQPAAATVSAGQPATFSVTATGTAPLSYQWQKNNTNISGATNASYTIASVQAADAGAYRVVVSNAVGSVTSSAAQLTVNAFNTAPVAQILTPAQGSLYRAGDVISFSGDATDTEDGTLPATTFTWLVDFYHDTHHHDAPPVATGTKSGTFTIPTSGEVADNVWYRLSLIVTDSQGLKDTTYIEIFPRKSTITLVTQPAGLQVTLDGQPVTTPLSDLSVEGIQRSIGAVSPQTLNGQTYVFDRWLHGGAATQTISTPVDDVTYTAVYTNSTLRTPENPVSTESGLYYQYYEGVWSALPDFNALTPAESGNIATPDLAPRNREDDYAFRFTGYIDIPADGLYTFYTSSDDGSQLFIGTTLVVNNNGLHGVQEASGTIGLKQGKHAVTVTFFEHLGSASLSASYSSAALSKRVIPASAYYRVPTSTPVTQQLEAELATLSGAIVLSNQAGYSGTGFADYLNPSNDYVQWAVNVPSAGNYTLTFRYALGATARSLAIRVNNVVVNAGLSFAPTGSWTTWNTVSLPATLLAGANTVRATAIGTSGPNVDYLKVESVSTSLAQSDLRAAEKGISIFPNPVSDALTISLSSLQETAIEVLIVDLHGRVVERRKLIQDEGQLIINVSNIPNGIYRVRVVGGETTITRSLVVDHHH
jgi:glucose/arabinose dehydrogenase